MLRILLHEPLTVAAVTQPLKFWPFMTKHFKRMWYHYWRNQCWLSRWKSTLKSSFSYDRVSSSLQTM